MKRFILLTALLTGPVARAQPLNPDPVRPLHANSGPRWVLKLAPLSLFDPDNTVQFGAERRLGGRNAVQVEFGYGPQGLNLWQNSQNRRYTDREVWRGRAEWRYYYGRNYADPLQGPYFAVEGIYKQLNARESGAIGMGCTGGPCQYYQLFTTPVQKYVWGIHAKVGRQFRLIPDNDRLLMDVYGGLGVRGRWVERFIQPGGTYFYESAGFNLFDAFSSGTYATISISYGLKVGYSF